MRLILTIAFALLGMVYAAGAFFFHSEECLARSRLSPLELDRSHHPEAILEAVREAMSVNDFSPPVLALVERSLVQVPSYYQPPFLLAAYHANRLEEPERTRAAFEATLERYPANGRLHLAYAQWLWTSHSIPPGGWVSPSRHKEQDTGSIAEKHLATALRLEPDLTGQGLELLRQVQVPPERWFDIFPDQKFARWELLKGFAEAGRTREALILLRETVDEWNDAAHLRQGAFWALEWGDARFALEAARLWQEAEGRPGGSKTRYYQAVLFLAKAHLELGETDEAFRVFRAALGEVGASSPVGLELLCSMASEYYRRGQVVLAQSLFAEATASSPNHVPSRLGLARTCRRMGNDTEAVEHYQKVLQLEPDNAAAEKELGELLLRRELGR